MTLYLVEKLVREENVYAYHWMPVSSRRPYNEAAELMVKFKEAYPFNNYRIRAVPAEKQAGA